MRSQFILLILIVSGFSQPQTRNFPRTEKEGDEDVHMSSTE